MSGIAASYISSTSFSVTGDQTSDFNTGRRCRSTCSGIYGYTTVVNSSYISPTTTVTITDGIINEGLTIAYYGVSADAAGSMPTHTHDGTEGEGGEITLLTLPDTPSEYDDTKYLKSTTSGTEWVSAVGGVTNHSELDELDYASAGHTGFAPTSHSHTESDISDLDKYTESEVNTISGSLQTDIDTKLENIIEDIDPELGGDLSCNNYNIENVGRICGNSLSSKIYNNTGSTLIKGTAVTICGLNEEVCTVCVSDNREIEKMPCCGVVDADIADGAEGCGIRVGRINMDTSGMTGSAKDRLYVQSDGSLDTVIPTSGMVQRVGLLVVKASGSAGRICVCIRGPRSMYSAKDQHPIVRMGGDAGHQKVVFRDYNDNKIAGLDNNGNLTISGTVDGVDVATFKSDYDVHTHDDRYYTESEVNTISGSLQTEIDLNTSVSHTQGTDTALGAVGAKNPPIDADKALYRDSTDSDVLVTSTWTQVKAFLKTYFDTLYNKYVLEAHKTSHQKEGSDEVNLDAMSAEGSSPTIVLQNTTEEDIEDGRESKFVFKGEQSGGEVSTLAEVYAAHKTAADDEIGKLILRVNNGASLTDVLELAAQGVAAAKLGNLGFSGDYPTVYFNAEYDGANQVFIQSDAAFCLWHDRSSDSLKIRYAADGVAGETISFSDAFTITDAGLVKAKHGISNDHVVTIDDADAADNDYAKFTADGLEGRSVSEVRSDLKVENTKNVVVKCIADDTALTTGNGKAHFTVPIELNGMDLVSVGAHVYTTSSSGIPTFQIYNLTQTADMLTTEITIDETEYDSKDAATTAVIDTNNDDVATGDVLRFDCDVAGTDTTGMEIRTGFRL